MKYLINKETRVLDCLILVDNYSYDSNCLELVETDLKTTHLVNKWNGYEWVEDATQEEIKAYEKSLVPTTISRMSFKIQLLLNRITIDEIIETISSLPDDMMSEIHKQIAIIKLSEANTFDRNDASLLMIAQMMEISNDKLDEIFINGNNM